MNRKFLLSGYCKVWHSSFFILDRHSFRSDSIKIVLSKVVFEELFFKERGSSNASFFFEKVLRKFTAKTHTLKPVLWIFAY